jgi:hypothetical protein
MERNDVQPWAKAPRVIVNLLKKIGGKNPYGEPTFRLSISEGVMKQAGAEWFKWREGSPARMNGTLLIDIEGNRVRPPAENPISITAEVRWTRKYPALKGWILEEWQPAHMFGTPEEWDGHRVPDHPEINALGPYPSDGKYLLSLPFGWGQPDEKHVNDPRFTGHPGLPTESALELAVQYVTKCRDYWGQMTPANRRRMMDDADLAQSALKEKYDHDRAYDAAYDVAQIITSTSPEAGRVREEWARGLKIGHVGN